MDDRLHITLEMEGVSSEHGHVSLSDFLGQLAILTRALKAVDRSFDANRKESLYYRVVGLSHSSPIRVTVEPVPKKGKPGKPVKTNVEARHDFFFDQLYSIREKREADPSLSNNDLEAFRELALPTAKTIATKSVHNSKVSVALDYKLETQVTKLIAEESRSHGSLQGQLERVNLHGRSSFTIYPKVGAVAVYCEFSPDLRDRVREALDRDVRVRGIKFYRPEADYPHRMKVTSMEVIDDTNVPSLLDLKGIAPHATGEMDSEVFVRTIREEWSDGEED